MQLRISGVAALTHGQALKFEFQRDGETREGFVLRRGDDLFAYHNRCPHWGVDLDMGNGRFYAAKVDRIYCRNHGALFRVHDGYCDAGPCASESLERFECRVEGDSIVVSIPETVAERI